MTNLTITYIHTYLTNKFTESEFDVASLSDVAELCDISFSTEKTKVQYCIWIINNLITLHCIIQYNYVWTIGMIENDGGGPQRN